KAAEEPRPYHPEPSPLPDPKPLPSPDSPDSGFHIELDAEPSSGLADETVFTFSPTAHNLPKSTWFGLRYAVTYSNAECRQGSARGTLVSFNTSTGVFSCRFSRAGEGEGTVTATAKRF